MNDTEFWAKRIVEGIEIYLRRRPGSRWVINFCERTFVSGNAFVGGMFLHAERLADYHFRDQTFDSPDDAAEAVRRLVSI